MQTHDCQVCGQSNELPFLFCVHCGAPRLKLGQWRMFANLMLAWTAFMATYYFADWLGWDWPLHGFYALLLLQFMLALATGRPGLAWRFAGWFTGFFVAMTALFAVYFHFDRDAGIFLNAITAGPEAAAEYPLIFFPALGAIVILLLVPGYFSWERAYGWHNAYRIALLALLAGTLALLGGLRGAAWALVHNVFPDQNVFLQPLVVQAKPRYDEALALLALFLFRFFMIEIFVSSAVVGYKAAHAIAVHEAAARRELARLQAGALPATLPAALPVRPGLAGFSHSLLALAQALRQFFLILEHLGRQLIGTTGVLGRDLAGALGVFCVELLVPALAMVAISLLLLRLTLITKDYINTDSLGAVGHLLGCLAGLLVAAMVFIGCKAPFRWRRIAAFALDFFSWLGPILLICFLLTSILLYCTSRVLSGFDTEVNLPFRIGLLTVIDAAVVIVLLAFILLRRRLQPSVAAAAAVTDAAPETPEDNDELWNEAARRNSRKLPAPPRTGARDGVADAGVMVVTGLGAGTVESPATLTAAVPAAEPVRPARRGLFGKLRAASAQLQGKAHALGERMHGKPALVDQLVRLKQRHEEKVQQLASLETLKGTIAPEAYEKLWTEQRGELACLTIERDQAQAELDSLFAQQQLKRTTLTARLARARQQADDLARLQAAGVLKDEDYQKRAQLAETEVETLTRQLEECERVLGYLAPEAGAAGRGATDRPGGVRPGGSGN